ncbi:MAG TPA: hypothetical protein VFY73_01785, partial [Ideonella sp.]|uniref:hypothetical protein n=1 Tax=Ideonella sp. TaxID=1929293 RepID=UPI002E312CE8
TVHRQDDEGSDDRDEPNQKKLSDLLPTIAQDILHDELRSPGIQEQRNEDRCDNKTYLHCAFSLTPEHEG